MPFIPVDYDNRVNQKVSKDGALDERHHRLVVEGENGVPVTSMYLAIMMKEKPTPAQKVLCSLYTYLKRREIKLQL